MASKAPVLARVTEATTGDIEAPEFRDNACKDEDGNERSQNQQAAAIQQAENHGQAAKNFQPWQVEGKPNADCPRQHFVIVDVGRKPKWIKRLDHPRVNEDSANNKTDDAAKDIPPE